VGSDWCANFGSCSNRCIQLSVYVTNKIPSPTTTIAMVNIREALSSAIGKISDQNYKQTFAFYRFWFDTGQIYHQIPSDLILNTILDSRAANSRDPSSGEFIHATASLIPRFVRDAESDQILALHCSGLQSRLYTTILQGFFSGNLAFVRGKATGRWEGATSYFYANTNLTAHLANHGYVEEAAILNRILQSLISHPSGLYGHQADALIILFKLAGATFGAYADPSVVDRCFELLKGCYSRDWTGNESSSMRSVRVAKEKLVQVRTAVG
jgi:hypothetical protein